MRAQNYVHVLKQSGANVKRFGAEQLFRNSRNKFDGPGDVMLVHQLFQNQRRRDVYRHPGVMPFSMARRAFHDRIVICHSRLLRCARDAVDVRDKGNNRFAAAVRGYPSRGNSSHAMLDVKSIFLQDARDVTRRLVFLETQFAEAENFVHHLLRKCLEFVHFQPRLLVLEPGVAPTAVQVTRLAQPKSPQYKPLRQNFVIPLSRQQSSAK